MKNFIKKFLQIGIPIGISLLCIILMLCGFLIMNSYTNFLSKGTDEKTKTYTTQSSDAVNTLVNRYASLSEQYVNTLNQEFESLEQFVITLRTTTYEPNYSRVSYVRYFKDGVEYDSNGSEYTNTESTKIKSNAKVEATICVGYVTDSVQSNNQVAYCVPMKNKTYADTVVVFFDKDILTSFSESSGSDYIDSSEITAICTEEGEIVNLLKKADNMSVSLHNNVYEYLRGTINDKNIISEVQNLVSSGETGVFTVYIDNEKYLLSVGCCESAKQAISIIALYKDSVLSSSEGKNTVSTGTTIMFIVLILLCVLGTVILFQTFRKRKEIQEEHDNDKRLGCMSNENFSKSAKVIMDKNTATSFSIAVVEIRHYAYLSNQLSEEKVTLILQYLLAIIEKSLQINEICGHLEHGRFAILFHYREKDTLENRLKNIGILMGKYSGEVPENYTPALHGGIYETKFDVTNQVLEMINCAMEAKNLTTPYDFGTFHYFTESLREKVLMQQYVEINMESALKNKNFVLFYQPKYNINTKSQDGCEALVRWYNPDKDEYMPPAVFMPLFEANGFIIKLDKFVFQLVCKYVEDSINSRRRIYPISFNVSKATVTEPGFVEYCISTKKKFNITNGFITVEFSNIASYDDLAQLRDIIAKLRANGFKCSIDNYGGGRSSFDVLKSLPVDEIKLDRLFLKDGISKDRDEKVLQSIIDISKTIGYKVVQMGVETEEQLNVLEKLGCDTIQGYLYSKPLYLSDYVDFMENVKTGFKAANK